MRSAECVKAASLNKEILKALTAIALFTVHSDLRQDRLRTAFAPQPDLREGKFVHSALRTINILLVYFLSFPLTSSMYVPA